MWLCLKNTFLSVVHKDCKHDELLVRARRTGDIEKIFPHAKVKEGGGTDYQFRAVIKREDVVAAMTQYIMNLSASNFKNSVTDRELHDAYLRVWHDMMGLQTQPNGRGKPARQKSVNGMARSI